MGSLLDESDQYDEWDSVTALNELRKLRSLIAPSMQEFVENTPSLSQGNRHILDQIDDVFRMTADALLVRYGRSMWMESKKMESAWK